MYVCMCLFVYLSFYLSIYLSATSPTLHSQFVTPACAPSLTLLLQNFTAASPGAYYQRNPRVGTSSGNLMDRFECSSSATLGFRIFDFAAMITCVGYKPGWYVVIRYETHSLHVPGQSPRHADPRQFRGRTSRAISSTVAFAAEVFAAAMNTRIT